jgi:hypothetical protein
MARPARFDVLRAQRLAAPVTVYVEQFSAHPLEADAAELYGPPDGLIRRAARSLSEIPGAAEKAAKLLAAEDLVERLV